MPLRLLILLVVWGCSLALGHEPSSYRTPEEMDLVDAAGEFPHVARAELERGMRPLQTAADRAAYSKGFREGWKDGCVMARQVGPEAPVQMAPTHDLGTSAGKVQGPSQVPTYYDRGFKAGFDKGFAYCKVN